MDKEKHNRIVQAGLNHMKSVAPEIMLPQKDGPLDELIRKATFSVQTVHAQMKSIYEAARDNGELALPGAKGKLAAQCTDLFIRAFNDHSIYSADDILWLAAVAHAEKVIGKLM